MSGEKKKRAIEGTVIQKDFKNNSWRCVDRSSRIGEGTFEPVVVPKKERDVSAIEDKVLSDVCKRNEPA